MGDTDTMSFVLYDMFSNRYIFQCKIICMYDVSFSYHICKKLCNTLIYSISCICMYAHVLEPSYLF